MARPLVPSLAGTPADPLGSGREHAGTTKGASMQLVTSRTESDVGTIVMDNMAKRNALSEQLISEIRAALDGFRVAGVRAAVLRAPAGTKVWSAGHDIDELPSTRRDPLGWGDALRVLVR